MPLGDEEGLLGLGIVEWRVRQVMNRARWKG